MYRSDMVSENSEVKGGTMHKKERKGKFNDEVRSQKVKRTTIQGLFHSPLMDNFFCLWTSCNTFGSGLLAAASAWLSLDLLLLLLSLLPLLPKDSLHLLHLLLCLLLSNFLCLWSSCMPFCSRLLAAASAWLSLEKKIS